MGFDSPDHHHSQELLVDCGYTKVIASRVGALGSSIVRAAKPGDFTRDKREKPPHDSNSYIPRFPLGKLREFALKELQKATWNFSRGRVIGRGGFGTVFTGILSDGAMVAVKVLDKDSVQGLDQFQAEMSASCAIMGISHPNLLPAIGYRTSRKRKMVKVMIVYPFMANGDVGLYLGDRQPSRTPLDWTTRKRIALGVARGICSLHELGIVHHDIKPGNVMLDEDFNARVGDLGLAKFTDLPLNSYNALWFHGAVDSHNYDFTRICGTFGYMAPEMHFSGHCSRKSDVFAFGVTLIQIVTGKPTPFDDASEECSRLSILHRTEQLLKNDEDLTRHMHPRMLGMYDESEAIELIRLGLICAQYDPEKRPLMPEVIIIMEGSSATLKQRWDNYNYPWSAQQTSSDNQRKTDSDISSPLRRISSVGAGGSKRGDDDDKVVCCSYEFDINEEELVENVDDRNLVRQAEDFTSEESNKEYHFGNVGHQLHGHLYGVSCYNAVQPSDASGGVSSVESTSLASLRSRENDTWTEIVKEDQNERGDSKQLSSQANRHEVATKLREELDQMCEMVLKHQAAMEEMHQKQIEMELKHHAVMEEMHQKQISMTQLMIKMQGQYIRKVNEMQFQIDQLKGIPQKP